MNRRLSLRQKHTSTKILLAAAPLMSASQAWGCAVCGYGEDKSSTTFLISTVILSLVPLGLIGGIIYWIYKSTKRPVP